MLEILRDMPEELDIERLMYTLYVRQKIERAISDKNAGRVYTQEEVERRVESWFK